MKEFVPDMYRKAFFLLFLMCFFQSTVNAKATFTANKHGSRMEYKVSVHDASRHQFHIELSLKGWTEDSVYFIMPQWTPGYYQLMGYADRIRNIELMSSSNNMKLDKVSANSWSVQNVRKKEVKISYDIIADKKFVAQSYLDSNCAFLLPGSLFFYIPNHLDIPVFISVNGLSHWNAYASGLQKVRGKENIFYSPDIDILYDAPILAGVLNEIPPFYVNGIKHRFIGYKMGKFDEELFADKLTRIVGAASAIIRDIPYKEYTFLSIGPGRGGIEHANSSAVSFDGSQLNTKESSIRLFHFLAHEYFHHYNVKRIRPFELGPFDYSREARTNLLWVSEGLSVYYEYLIVRRAGLSTNEDLLKSLERNIESFENSSGKNVQSLIQSSYETWKEGPFGKNEGEQAPTISYYEKGPVIGLLLDLAIRKATNNTQSLDDVMRFLYNYYYKKLNRGFTDAEFQQVCEQVAGKSLKSLFTYVYTPVELDYDSYLSIAGLELMRTKDSSGKFIIQLKERKERTSDQLEVWKGITGE
jgi:predicted metalloprotease with PDZ domain